MRIIYLSAVLLGVSPLVGAETDAASPGQPTWQDIVRSTQDRKPEVVEELSEPEEEVNTLYKVVDENGVTSFTDVAPADAKNVESIKVDAKPSLNVLGGKSYERHRYESDLNQQIEEREQRAAQHQKTIKDAKKLIQLAKKRLEEGSEPVNEDWQNTVNGRRFLKPAYFARKQALADSVEEAEKHLQSLQRQRP